MPDAGIVDVAIGLTFVYVLLSLICSALAEWVSRLFALRARNLEKGIRSLVHDESSPDTAVEDGQQVGSWHGSARSIYAHPIVAGFSRRGWFDRWRNRPGRPSYLPSRAFAATIVDLLIPAEADKPAPDIQELRAAIGGLPEGHLKRSLLVLLAQGGHNLTAFRTAIEQWFDDGMERVSGWYKRNLQLMLLGIALIVAGALNADTFLIGERLWRDEVLRTSVASAAEQYVADQAAAEAAGPPGAAGDQLETNIEVLQEQVEQLRIPMGWSDAAARPDGYPWQDASAWLAKLGGLVVTAIALSLGAPFWFDLLNRLVNLRASGAPPSDGNTGKPQYGRSGAS